MNKKEEIKFLKAQLKNMSAYALVQKEALEPYKQRSLQRGARMQIMYKHICAIAEYDYELPEHFKEWFDRDGVPL